MNQKVCKKIRRHVREQFVSTTEQRYNPTGLFTSEIPQGYSSKEKLESIPKTVSWTKPITLNTGNAHGMYKHIKKHLKKNSHDIGMFRG